MRSAVQRPGRAPLRWHHGRHRTRGRRRPRRRPGRPQRTAGRGGNPSSRPSSSSGPLEHDHVAAARPAPQAGPGDARGQRPGPAVGGVRRSRGADHHLGGQVDRRESVGGRRRRAGWRQELRHGRSATWRRSSTGPARRRPDRHGPPNEARAAQVARSVLRGRAPAPPFGEQAAGPAAPGGQGGRRHAPERPARDGRAGGGRPATRPATRPPPAVRAGAAPRSGRPCRPSSGRPPGRRRRRGPSSTSSRSSASRSKRVAVLPAVDSPWPRWSTAITRWRPARRAELGGPDGHAEGDPVDEHDGPGPAPRSTAWMRPPSSTGDEVVHERRRAGTARPAPGLVAGLPAAGHGRAPTAYPAATAAAAAPAATATAPGAPPHAGLGPAPLGLPGAGATTPSRPGRSPSTTRGTRGPMPLSTS